METEVAYQRVIPRDLFNEANLLKCYGQLYLLLEAHIGHGVQLGYTGAPFRIEQNPADGSLTITNVILTINRSVVPLMRPLNSREPWPLYAFDANNEVDIAVFTDDGKLTDEFQALLPNR